MADNWRDALIIEQELRLLQLAAPYDLISKEERARSNANLRALFFDLVAALKPTLFVEAGAMAAEASVQVKQKLRQTRVVAFEANPHNFARFKDKPDLMKAGVEYLHHAVARAPGPVTFQVQATIAGAEAKRITGRNSLLRRTDPNVTYEPVTVEGVSLDSFFPETKARCAIWIDVEGAIKEVLLGAEQFLRSVDVMMVEVEEHRYWEEQWLERDVVRHLNECGIVPVARDFEFGRQHNLVLCSAAFLTRPDVKNALASFHGRASQKPS